MNYTPKLQGRPYDWFFVFAFSLFAIITVFMDLTGVLTGYLDPHGKFFFERWLFDYARHCDPLLLINTPQVRVSIWAATIFFFPLHIYFVMAFYKGWNNIKLYGTIYCGAMLLNMLTYMAEGLFGYMATVGWQNPAICADCLEPDRKLYIMANSMYFLLPLLLLIRIRKKEPFGPETE